MPDDTIDKDTCPLDDRSPTVDTRILHNPSGNPSYALQSHVSLLSFTKGTTRGHQEESKEIDQSINTYTLLYKQGDVHCRFIPRTARIPVKAFFGRRRK